MIRPLVSMHARRLVTTGNNTLTSKFDHHGILLRWNEGAHALCSTAQLSSGMPSYCRLSEARAGLSHMMRVPC